MRKFEYSKTEYEMVCEECMLTEDERIILKARCQGKSAIEIIHILDENKIPMSTATLSRKISKINKKITSMTLSKKQKGDGF